MKVAELKEKAKSLGIKGYYKMKKQQLLDIIKSKEEAVEEVKKVEETKDNFFVKLIGNGGSIVLPLVNIETRHDMIKEYMDCVKKLDKNYPLIELYNGEKLLRRQKRR